MDVAKRSTRAILGALALVLTVGSLTACGEAAPTVNVPPGDYPDLSLTESKSPAQLLRNTAVSRIPAEVILNAGTDTDGSEACLTEAQDPDGVIRRWKSSVDVNLRLPEAPNTEAIVDAVLATFTDEGWMSQAITGSKADNQAHLLTNETAGTASVSGAQLRIEAVVASDEASSFIRVEAIGPCVVTGGASSAEVIDLGKL
jgi:predicted small lipoprotein YifL